MGNLKKKISNLSETNLQTALHSEPNMKLKLIIICMCLVIPAYTIAPRDRLLHSLREKVPAFRSKNSQPRSEPVPLPKEQIHQIKLALNRVLRAQRRQLQPASSSK